MTKRGDKVGPHGSFLFGAFGTMNLSDNVNIIDDEMTVKISLQEDHDRINNVEIRLCAIETQITAMVQHINEMNKMLQMMYFAPGMPGYETGKQSFEEAQSALDSM